MNEILAELWERHRGKILGLTCGLTFGCLILIFGFWRSFFVSLCAAAGYIIGKLFDENGNLKDFYERVFLRHR